MKYAVAVKQVPDTMRAAMDEKGHMIRSGVPSILNPYCEHALRSIISIREEGDEVVVFTMGPPSAETTLRRCLALGADSAYLLTDSSFAGSDVWATSRVLSSFVSKYVQDADLIVFGREAIDGDTGQVPFEVAGIMGRQQFAYVSRIGRDGEVFTVDQDYGDSIRTSKVPKGSVVSFRDPEVRGSFPTIRQVLDSEHRGIIVLDRVKLGLGFYSVGANGSMTRITRTWAVETSRRNTKVEFRDPRNAVPLLKKELEGI